jgi:cellulose synthase/poly-beta-1,6-N-acetylglucosamine synthase-like glycosyltransferase
LIEQITQDTRVFVLANGCRDGTAAIARACSAGHPNIEVRELELGDKANAWNVFTHEIAPQADIVFFHDGDCFLEPGALEALERDLIASPKANVAAAVPSIGRDKTALTERLEREHLLVGNLYAVRGSMLQAFREAGVKLPIGQFGEDGLVAALIKRNLDFLQPELNERVVVSRDAKFGFDSLSMTNPEHWKIYHRRMRRYANRFIQISLLYPRLRARGTSAMPASVDQLIAEEFPKFKLRWNGIAGIYELIAWFRLRRRHGELTTHTDT